MSQSSFRKYKSSGKFSFGGLILLLLATTIGGVLIGAVAAAIAQYVYLVLAFPLAMIITAAILIGKIAKAGKIRSWLLSFLAGLWMAVMMYGSYWTGEYLFLVESVYQDLQEEDLSRLDVLELINEDLVAETDYSYVIGYFIWSTEEGLQLTSTSPGNDSVISLSRDQARIYWGVEALSVLLFTALAATVQSSEPFSEKCGRWYKDGDTKFAGFVSEADEKTFIQLLRDGNIQQAGQLVSADAGETELYAYYFSDCADDEVLFEGLREVKNKNAIRVQGIMSTSDFEQHIQKNTSQAFA